MPESCYSSYAVTISTKEQVEGELEEVITKFLHKQPFSYGVIESKNGSLHSHFQLWLDEPRPKSQVFKQFKKNVMALAPTSLAKYAILAKIAYSDDYITYMDKEIIKVLSDNPPLGDTSPYYPSQEEQDKVQAKANAKDGYYHMLSELWHEYNPNYEECETTKYDVAHFLFDIMFKEKRIQVITDDKRRKQVAKCLWKYLYPTYEKSMCLTNEEIEFLDIKNQFNKNT